MTNYQDRRFTLLGVNIAEYEPAQLKKVITKEQLNWRSIGMSETIIEKWNAGTTPAYYLIDADGIIRRKWIGNPGGEVLEKAIDKVLDESKN